VEVPKRIKGHDKHIAMSAPRCDRSQIQLKLFAKPIVPFARVAIIFFVYLNPSPCEQQDHIHDSYSMRVKNHHES
jgi:hypothetical protein